MMSPIRKIRLTHKGKDNMRKKEDMMKNELIAKYIQRMKASK